MLAVLALGYLITAWLARGHDQWKTRREAMRDAEAQAAVG